MCLYDTSPVPLDTQLTSELEMTIPTGSLCYVIRVELGNERYLGRTVTVISPAIPMPQRGGVAMHWIDSAWLRLERPGCRCFAPPSSLLPIAGPGKPPLETRKREPERA